MKKQALGVFLGGLTLFIWSLVTWMLLPFHDATMKFLPEEQLISDTLKTVVKEPGMYYFPSDKTAEGRLSQETWKEKYRKGPVGMLVYSPMGMEPMGGKTFLVEFLTDLAIAALVMYILMQCAVRVGSVGGRVKLGILMGLLVWVVAHVPYWNWFHFPLVYTLTLLFDVVGGFALLSLVLSKFVPE